MRKLLLATAALLSFGGAATAMAAPVTTNPGVLTANGAIQAVFAYKDAADMSTLLRVGFGGVIFNNQTDAIGTTKNVGSATGAVTFQLNNMSQGYSFFTGIADSGSGGDGFYHAIYSSTFSTFGVGALSSAAQTAIASLSGPVLYVGFEDRRGGDYDYNDLIFAFSSVTIPEPASLAIFGAGLLGIGLTRLRRRA